MDKNKMLFKDGLFLEDDGITIPWKCSFSDAKKIVNPDNIYDSVVKFIDWHNKSCIGGLKVNIRASFLDANSLLVFSFTFMSNDLIYESYDIVFQQVKKHLDKIYGYEVIDIYTINAESFNSATWKLETCRIELKESEAKGNYFCDLRIFHNDYVPNV